VFRPPSSYVKEDQIRSEIDAGAMVSDGGTGAVAACGRLWKKT